MNTQHCQDMVLKKTSYLAEEAVTQAFNLIIRWSCSEMSSRQPIYRCFCTTKLKLIGTVRSSLGIAAMLYGIRINEMLGDFLSKEIANFILSNCYYKKTFHTPMDHQRYDINSIPDSIYFFMIENFNAKKMDRDLYRSFIESN